MATYNGMPYIRTQILSLISQTHTNWKLYIHDDGSTDGTQEEIEKFTLLDKRIHYIKDNKRWKSAGKNFMSLLSASKNPYICFCDQDDFWFENKLEIMLREIMQINPHKPCACFFNAYTWFPSEGNRIGKKVFQHIPSHNLYDYLFTNGGMQGASAIFNASMRDYINIEYNSLYMHDHILTFAALIKQNLYFKDIPLMLYRQHNKNVTGHINQSIWQLLSFQKIYNKTPALCQSYVEGTKEFYKLYKRDMNTLQQKQFDKFFTIIQGNKLNAIFHIIANKATLRGSTFLLIAKLLTRPFIK